MSYLLNALVLVCFYLFMCCPYLMMDRTYTVPSYIIKCGELITVNILDCEETYFRLRHDGGVAISDTSNYS